MIRSVTRRLQKIERHVAAVNEPPPEPHRICFVNMQREITSTLLFGRGGQPNVWTKLTKEQPPGGAPAQDR
jgi:hypothetical protein